MFGIVTLPGCGGCSFWKSPAQAKADKEKAEAERKKKEEEEKRKRKKPNYEIGTLAGQPAETLALPPTKAYKKDSRPRPGPFFCKPGHWTHAGRRLKTNHFDVLGDLEVTVRNRGSRPRELEQAPFTLTTVRQFALNKQQEKVVDALVFVPPTGKPVSIDIASADIDYDLVPKRGVRTAPSWLPPDDFHAMPAHQYHLVVMARKPQTYLYVRSLDSTLDPGTLSDFYRSERKDEVGKMDNRYYRVHLIDGTQPNQHLPSQALFWTGISHLIWDDADPNSLRIDQQQALVDWLHWGGRLIVSGPSTLETLRGSFLQPYLPASVAESRQLTSEDLEPFNARWTLPNHVPWGAMASREGKVSAIEAVVMKLRPGAAEIPGTAGLVAQRRAGRGTVVVTAFRLSSNDFRNWSCRDSFFNGCLLGRAARRFAAEEGSLEGAGVHWTASGIGRYDPRMVTPLRYFSRDEGREISVRPNQPMWEDYGYNTYGMYGNAAVDEVEDVGPRGSGVGDVGSWTDFSPAAIAARDTLKDVARVEVPDRSFVLWVVGAYLLVLVPVNWILFKLIGRIEWAWIAAPLIAIGCTATVIHVARLDIGFARATTEVAIIEMQPEYDRAHVSRYMALYTALSSSYEFSSDDLGMQILPMAMNTETSSSEGIRHLRYEYGKEVELTGLHITSNNTKLVHCEQMVALGGAIEMVPNDDGLDVVNRTTMTLQGTGVLRRDEAGLTEVAWIGSLEPEESAVLRFSPMPEEESTGTLWQQQRRELALDESGEELWNLDRLFELAQRSPLERGQARLVGWSDDRVGRLRISPDAAQRRQFSLVIAHLNFPLDETAEPDVNSRAEAEAKLPKTLTPGDIPQSVVPNSP